MTKRKVNSSYEESDTVQNVETAVSVRRSRGISQNADDAEFMKEESLQDSEHTIADLSKLLYGDDKDCTLTAISCYLEVKQQHKSMNTPMLKANGCKFKSNTFQHSAKHCKGQECNIFPSNIISF
uniref:C2H2-type domain-containing protein n=1 Tax=Rhabditophanes sp. KR3021 TaxID=114890 RepID=A0AC35TZS2_9BILA